VTAPADIPALIAEGRRLIAAATPGLAVACYETEADGSEGRPIVCLGQDHGGPLVSSDSTQGLVCLTTEDRDLIVFAVNNLAALLDVAEAAAREMEENAALGRGVDPALDSALSRLRGVRT